MTETDGRPDHARNPRHTQTLAEIITLGRTPKKHANDILAYSNQPGYQQQPY
ncbi:hypothetical protein [Cutibacterium modestum]|uniref:Uncharacterized protein n=2 Tax=Cutibacterium modestum TaxID=2559073 RepID=A0AAD1KR16_9ACTN|nr:hypothetical protein [Cutibacterium modestum]EFS75190.1 hypothetical protein HMPREF9621_00824 [Cutibacterium modestum HL037PA2]EFS93144.1 hypothetical protein HMPREF9607_00620 [Cutibacterium modestum HL044PA1]EFT15781.1 hypothetical protein HMPREF9622_01211 [Cutibacterium modestum HL037PA3]EGG26744.1 hypothetical protein PA08_0978 [Cutibacterium modestum P08]BCY25574.1 hypothetical protein KB1_15640 [Cutibacterium modestum]